MPGLSQTADGWRLHASAGRREDVSTVLQLDDQTPSAPRLVFCWGEPDRPLPVRAVRGPAQPRTSVPSLDGQAGLTTGPAGAPFDFCGHVHRLCADIVRCCEALRHIDVSRLLFAMTQARISRSYGLQARTTPFRLRDGLLTRQRRSVTYQVQRYFVGPHEILYLLTFCLPRFLDQAFDDKFITLFHELYHISPAFNGDLRRHDGRYTIHSHSKRGYDQYMADLAREYLASRPDPALHAFLRLNFAQLEEKHGSVRGVVVPRPKLIPIGQGS